VNWIWLDPDMVKWWGVVNMVMNLWVWKHARSFLNRVGPVLNTMLVRWVVGWFVLFLQLQSGLLPVKILCIFLCCWSSSTLSIWKPECLPLCSFHQPPSNSPSDIRTFFSTLFPCTINICWLHNVGVCIQNINMIWNTVESQSFVFQGSGEKRWMWGND
jgi:hypothetical protein